MKEPVFEIYNREKDISKLLEWYDGKRITIPFIQREFVWSKETQSLLIDSVLKGFPIPPLYLYNRKKKATENQLSDLYVLDGLQRLMTFNEFISNELSLKLDSDNEYNGKKFKDLDSNEQTIFKETNIRYYELNPMQESLEAMADLFKRLNTGGVALSDEELLILTLSISIENINDNAEKIVLAIKNINELKISKDFFKDKVKNTIIFAILANYIYYKEGKSIYYFGKTLKEAVSKATKNFASKITIKAVEDFLERYTEIIEFLIESQKDYKLFFRIREKDENQLGLALFSNFFNFYSKENSTKLLQYFTKMADDPKENSIILNFSIKTKEDRNRIYYSEMVYNEIMNEVKNI